MQSEFDFIKRIRGQAMKRYASDLILGIGDDAAILRELSGREMLVTIDLLVEDIDFKIEYAPPRWLGHKALAASLSDIAAMGGAPRFSLLTLGIPKQNPQSPIRNLRSEAFWDEFFAGYFTLAQQHDVSLIGGDISSTPDKLTIDSLMIGHCSAGKAVKRSGARVGDSIYLTGSAGASAAGLKLLLKGARIDQTASGLVESAIRAHLMPEPRIDFGWQIGEMGLARAMIDVSDGLAQDLARICEASRVTAIIDFESIPIAEEVRLVAEDEESAFDLAITGGEDFELLLTVTQDNEPRVIEIAADCGLRLTRIGEITAPDDGPANSPIRVRKGGDVKPLSTRGYDHFSI